MVQSCDTSDALAVCLFFTGLRIYISFAVPRYGAVAGCPHSLEIITLFRQDYKARGAIGSVLGVSMQHRGGSTLLLRSVRDERCVRAAWDPFTALLSGQNILCISCLRIR